MYQGMRSSGASSGWGSGRGRAPVSMAIPLFAEDNPASADRTPSASLPSAAPSPRSRTVIGAIVSSHHRSTMRPIG